MKIIRVKIVSPTKYFIVLLFRESYTAYYVENRDPASTLLSNLFYSAL